MVCIFSSALTTWPTKNTLYYDGIFVAIVCDNNEWILMTRDGIRGAETFHDSKTALISFESVWSLTYNLILSYNKLYIWFFFKLITFPVATWLLLVYIIFKTFGPCGSLCLPPIFGPWSWLQSLRVPWTLPLPGPTGQSPAGTLPPSWTFGCGCFQSRPRISTPAHRRQLLCKKEKKLEFNFSNITSMVWMRMNNQPESKHSKFSFKKFMPKVSWQLTPSKVSQSREENIQ